MMTGIILAGGKNSRINQEKAFLEFPSLINNKSILIELTLSKFRDIFEEIIIVTNSPEKFEYLGTILVRDIFANKGSLGGIYSGLKKSTNEFNFITACDMPFLSIEFMKYMIKFPKNYDVLIPKTEWGFETMHAIYSKNCLKSIEKNIKLDNLKILDFFKEMNVVDIHENSMKKIDNKLSHSFFNINTKEDYERAIDLFQKTSTL